MNGEPGATVELLQGARIQGFEIEALLGRGSMGEVYRAFDHDLERRVAIKRIVADPARGDEFIERFRREAKTASSILHPNVAQVFSAGEFAGRPFYVMEFVDGESLADLLQRGGRLSGRGALDLLIQACRGLAAAWSEGVVHRDIKPSNLIRTASGELKIVDFGLARSVSDDARLTHPDLVVGTPTYTAPEQALGLEVDHRADIYSLGATFFHLFTGTPLFTAESAVSVLVQHVEAPPTPLAGANPSVPPAVGAVIDRMLAKDRADRWQAYDELIEELERVQAGGGTGARSAAGRGLPWHRMPVFWVASSLFLALTLAFSLQKERPPAVSEPSGAERSAEGDGSPEFEATDESDELMEQVRLHPLMSVAWKAQTLANMRRLTTAVEMHISEQATLPESTEQLRSLYGLHPMEMVDAWGEPIALETDGDHYVLRSSGPDREPHTEDDLVIEDGFVVQGGPQPPV